MHNFRMWAPRAQQAAVDVGDRQLPMVARGSDGWTLPPDTVAIIDAGSGP
jgi:1,4-alpha-glucan branching enzyme